MRTPFDRTEAFRRYGYAVDRAGPGEEDLYTKALLQEQGFDGPPHVVAREQLDAYVRAGEVELFRGVSAKAHANQLRTGEFYAGHGAYGGGIYTVGGRDGFTLARDYAQDPGGVVMGMAVKQGARVIDLAQISRQMRAALAGRGSSAHATSNPDTLATLTYYPGLYGAYLGYDAIVNWVEGVWLILNRTALRIQEEDLTP